MRKVRNDKIIYQQKNTSECITINIHATISIDWETCTDHFSEIKQSFLSLFTLVGRIKTNSFQFKKLFSGDLSRVKIIWNVHIFSPIFTI